MMTAAGLEIERLRQDFPGLAQTVHGKPLVYLDNAATTQKPRAVIEAVCDYYARDCANIHRGVHLLSERATAAYEAARRRVRRFLGASSEREVVFVRGTTEAVNLVAHSFVRPRLNAGDEVLITAMEHHSNIVPWQMICEEKGASLRVAPVDDRGELILEEFGRMLGPRTRFVSAAHVSNALGTVNPVRQMASMARERGIPMLIDGAQAAPHQAVDVREIGCDFYAFSGHKVYGPTGIGVLYGKEDLLDRMPPYQGGGDMIRSVTFEKTVYNDLPYKFEAGTPDIAGAIGLGAAVEYLENTGLENIAAHEGELLGYAMAALEAIGGVRVIGAARHKAAVLSFVVEGVHAHDVGTILDQEGVAVRAGHHCAQPLMARFGLAATARASFAMYNTAEDVEALARAVRKAKEVLG
jgi:cysteine desulfurase/selenocysteine lyase